MNNPPCSFCGSTKIIHDEKEGAFCAKCYAPRRTEVGLSSGGHILGDGEISPETVAAFENLVQAARRELEGEKEMRSVDEVLREIIEVSHNLRELTPPGYRTTEDGQKAINRLCGRQVELFIELAQLLNANLTATLLEQQLKYIRVFPI